MSHQRSSRKRRGWWDCPSCGLPNIEARRICKRCRYIRPTRGSSLSLGYRPVVAANTEVTGTIYRSDDRRHVLFCCPYYLEYTGPVYMIRTDWSNVRDIQTSDTDSYLWLIHPAIAALPGAKNNRFEPWMAQAIPLRCFGYPANSTLAADLRRFAPQLAHGHDTGRSPL